MPYILLVSSSSRSNFFMKGDSFLSFDISEGCCYIHYDIKTIGEKTYLLILLQVAKSMLSPRINTYRRLARDVASCQLLELFCM